MSDKRPEFWIDVGGTFTDCFGRAVDGALARHKILSTGVTKGSVAAGSSRESILDPIRRRDPDQFWTGYRLRLLDPQGGVSGEATVRGFDRARGELGLERALPLAPRPGQQYELFSGEEAPLVAIRYLLGLGLNDPIPSCRVRLGTTRGTNALITRTGAKTALVTTRGFGDILHIGYQNRPRLFDLDIEKPAPLFAATVEIDERVAADGEVLQAPDAGQVRRRLGMLRSQGIESLAICLLHSFAYPAHEELVAGIARELGFAEVSVSSAVAPLMKIVARGDTTVVDAYLNPVLRTYIDRLLTAMPQSGLKILTSAGGLVSAASFVGKDSILSGPAGGVVGFSRAAMAAGLDRAIGFDMGGTSTDVSRFDGGYEMEFETETSGVRIVAPMMAIETVAAGGGSICRFDGVKLVVGPASAGADPGPACYGRGGPLTVTDANFFQGKIVAERFPFALDRRAVEMRLADIASEILASGGPRYTLAELAAGFVRVANTHMAKAIRSISVAKGCDPRNYALVAFGGAAGQHACAIADELGIRQILSHPDAGLLSAYGIGLADIVRQRVAGVYRSYCGETMRDLEPVFDRLSREAVAEVVAEGIPAARVEVTHALELRYRGVDAALTIRRPGHGDYRAAFLAEHQKLYGYVHDARELEIVAARIEARGLSGQEPPSSARVSGRQVHSARTAGLFLELGETPAEILDRSDLRPGDRIIGPAVICELASTTVIDPRWQAEVLSEGELLLTPVEEMTPTTATLQDLVAATVSVEANPIALEVFNNHFAGIAEQMGITLRNTSSSVNVKERLDFSCAIFTPTGELVVNAPHIPVHLGAMSETVRHVLADNPSLQPGDVFVTNDPYRGGSHLPDITVVTPVHDRESGRLVFFTASRAHHAEIGGIVPGSMPPFSRNLAEEGVLLRNFKLLSAAGARWHELREMFERASYPSRDVATNLADLAAQVAANQRGTRELWSLAERYGLDVVEAYLAHIQGAAEQKVRRALARLSDGVRRFVDHMDDGSPIAVTMTIACAEMTIDFSGSGPVSAGNLNANRAIVTAAVMYVLRCLIDEDIPLNQGILAPITLVLPEGLLNPREQARLEDCPAVAGGNVETSQRVVDVLLGALGLAAASQGTMNNLVFGDGTFGYYETLCGGAGATPRRSGADAVHTHMTNTRLTDPEVIERRYPVRVREFSIRRGSGGAGRQPGGDGVVRVLEFLKPLEVSILSQRRGPFPPYGLEGGSPGGLGRNAVLRADGTPVQLEGQSQFMVQPGDVLTIETPGGGGYGPRP